MANTVEWKDLIWRAAVSRADFEVPLGGTIVRFSAENYNMGAVYDSGTWFAQGELSRMDFGQLANSQKAWYMTVGYQWNAFKPFVTFSRVKPSGVRPGLTSRDQRTIAAGIRWDLVKNVALKIQVDQVKLAPGNLGFFTNAQSGLAGTRGNVVSIAADFAF